MNKMLKAIALLILFIMGNASAEKKVPKEINIFAWWAMIDEVETVSAIEKLCNAKLMVDEFYTDTEFLRRYNDADYDIYVYSDTASGVLNRKLENNDINIQYLTKYYDPHVLKNFSLQRRGSNTAIMGLSANVIIWNNSIINIENIKSLTDLKRIAEKGVIIFPDDPVEAYTFLKISLNEKERRKILESHNDPYGFDYFFSGLNVKIANNLIASGTGEAFLLSYFWSGGAVQFYKRVKDNLILKNPSKNDNSTINIKRLGARGYPSYTLDSRDYEYNFFPKFSFIILDLLTLMTDDPTARCVADQLGQGPHHREILNSTYYLSPTLAIPEKADQFYRQMRDKFIKAFPRMSWKKGVYKEQYYELNRLWQKIRTGF